MTQMVNGIYIWKIHGHPEHTSRPNAAYADGRPLPYIFPDYETKQ